MTPSIRGIILAVTLQGMFLAASTSAHAAQFIGNINSLANTGAFDNPITAQDESRDGICADQSGACTLRAALQEAKNMGLPAVITFGVSGTIQGGLDVPDGSIILGPDVGAIVIQGGGLDVGSNSFVRKLTITGGAVGVVVRSNSIVEGLTITGASAVGMVVQSGSIIGGNKPESKNVITGNTTAGIVIGGDGNLLQGNHIKGNGTGIQVSGDNNHIGGNRAGESNVISGNLTGIAIGNDLPAIRRNNAIIGNRIGLDESGSPLGNLSDGVHLVGAESNSIILNTIALNGGHGIAIIDPQSTGNRISGNSIFSNVNGPLGINLFGGNEIPPGVTLNDPADADLGPNELQNYPVLMSAFSDNHRTRISGTLNHSCPN